MLPGLSLRSRSVPGDVDHLTLTLQAPTLLDTRARVCLGDSEGLYALLLWNLMDSDGLVDCMDYYVDCSQLVDCMDYYYGLLYPIIIYCMSYCGVYGICTVYALRLLIYIVLGEYHIYLLMTYVNVIFVFRLNQK
jgi:hypothetical protein